MGDTLACCSGRFEWGSCAVTPELEVIVEACRPGGAASCSLAIPLGGPNPLSANDLRCRLEVRTEQRVNVVATGARVQQEEPIFVPPMSTQASPRAYQQFRCPMAASKQLIKNENELVDILLNSIFAAIS